MYYHINIDIQPKPHFSLLVTTPSKRPRRDILVIPLYYEYRPNLFIKVPSKFDTDYASVPKIFWPILSPWGRYREAAVVHDYLYRNIGKINIYNKEHAAIPTTFTRAICDKIFFEAMAFCHVSEVKRKIMYKAVRYFGWYAWNRYK